MPPLEEPFDKVGLKAHNLELDSENSFPLESSLGLSSSDVGHMLCHRGFYCTVLSIYEEAKVLS